MRPIDGAGHHPGKVQPGADESARDPREPLASPRGGFARGYTADDLRHSDEDMITCSECGIVIDPGSRLVYLVGAKEGFFFYHEGCEQTGRSFNEPPQDPVTEHHVEHRDPYGQAIAESLRRRM